MDEEEAEAVLIALGVSLDWTSLHDGEIAQTDAGTYSICLTRSLDNNQLPVYLAEFSSGLRRDGSRLICECKSETAAKFVCERHRATGEWQRSSP